MFVKKPLCTNFQHFSTLSAFEKIETLLDIQDMIVCGCLVLLLLKELFYEAVLTLSLPTAHQTNAQLIWKKQLSGESVGQYAFSVIVINLNPQSVEITKTLSSRAPASPKGWKVPKGHLVHFVAGCYIEMATSPPLAHKYELVSGWKWIFGEKRAVYESIQKIPMGETFKISVPLQALIRFSRRLPKTGLSAVFYTL